MESTVRINLNSISTFVQDSVVYGLDDAVANQTILSRKNSRKIKLPDEIIAAIALCVNLDLISRNVSDFSLIDGLTIIDPFKT